MPRTTATSAMNTSSATDSRAMRSASDMDRGTPTDRANLDLNRSSSDMTRGTATDRAANTNRDMNRDRARDINQGTGGTDAQLERTRSMEQTQGSADRRGTPTDTQSASNPQAATSQDMRMQTGEMTNTSSWDKACFISTRTSQFLFQAPDGSVLKVDDAGNQQIKALLDSTSRVANKNKIFRAKVTGTIEGDTLHVTNIVI